MGVFTTYNKMKEVRDKALNTNQFELVQEVAAKMGYDASPRPELGDDQPYVDIDSGMESIQPARLLIALHEAAGLNREFPRLSHTLALPNRITFLDITVAAGW
jgi:hypothetical protein